MLELPVLDSPDNRPRRRLPPWLKRPLPAGEFGLTKQTVADSRVATVCQEARCPNLTECWSARTATFMILGEHCTRRCHFCAVSTARPDPPAADEPRRLADAVARLGLRHVVITAVARDDLPDEGAGHFAQCVREVHRAIPTATVEVLPADFHARSECLETLCRAEPEIYNHNIETVERLSPAVRPQARYHRSLEVLRVVRELDPAAITKSGLMIGLGETEAEIEQTFVDLREVGCDVLTVGQYLQPTPGHTAVERYYRPEEFDRLAATASGLGFLSVAAGPFVRSSYNAAEAFDQARSKMRGS
ncbi:MAG: lipoyl synthase [bacterium]|nr:lipoyl synthase [bacterium]